MSPRALPTEEAVMPVQKFELATEHDAGVAARFLACEEIHRARTMLTAHPTGFARAFHEFQKSMKGLRALARLLRGSMKADFRPCSRALRDAKRVLADFRDDNATFEAVRMLRSEYLDEGEHRVVDRIERRLHRDGDRGVPDDLPERTALALQALARAEGLFEAVELHSYQELSEGLCRSYRRARKRYREASRQPDDATLHELRKRIDDVRFHLLLLGHSAPTLHQAESELASAI